jgi:hypothetical protein
MKILLGSKGWNGETRPLVFTENMNDRSDAGCAGWWVNIGSGREVRKR